MVGVAQSLTSPQGQEEHKGIVEAFYRELLQAVSRLIAPGKNKCFQSVLMAPLQK